MKDTMDNLSQGRKGRAVTIQSLAGEGIQGISDDGRKCRKPVETSAALIPALAPVLGCEHATRLVKRALREEKSIRQIICEDRLLSTEQIDVILNLPALSSSRELESCSE